MPTPETPPKTSHIGAPACFALELACKHLTEAFDGYGCYVVGSALSRSDWRDVDVRFIMADDEFAKLFPDAGTHWECDPRWLLLTVSISRYLSHVSGLPIDFQFQPQTHANERHKGNRNAVGLNFAKPAKEESMSETPPPAMSRDVFETIVREYGQDVSAMTNLSDVFIDRAVLAQEPCQRIAFTHHG